MLSWASHMSLRKHMTASAVKIVMFLDVERSGYNECCATSAIFCNVTFLTVFLFCYTISRENRNKISENSFVFISSYTFFALQCFIPLFVRVVTTLFPDPGFSLTSIESSLSRINPDFYTQKSDDISQSKRRRKNDIQIKIITQLFKRDFHLVNLYLFIHIFALHVLYSRTGCWKH